MKKNLIFICVITILLLGFTAYSFYETSEEKAKQVVKQIQNDDFSEIPKESKEQVISFMTDLKKIKHNDVDVAFLDSKDNITAIFRIVNMSSDNSEVIDSYYGELDLNFKRESWSELNVIDVKVSPIKKSHH